MAPEILSRRCGGGTAFCRELFPRWRTSPRHGLVLLLSVAASALLRPLLSCQPWAFVANAAGGRRTSLARPAFDLGKTIGGLLGEDEEDVKSEVPKDVSALVEGLRMSTEASLNQRCSRLDVELPPAYRLGVEGDKKKSDLVEEKAAKELKEIARGDRELARIFVEMLQPIGAGVVVAFRTKALAAAARKAWKLAPEEGTVIAFPDMNKKSAFATEVGVPSQFKQKLREDLACQCLIVVSPYLDQLRLVEDLGNTVQDQMGIVLLNARISGKDRKMSRVPPKLQAALQEVYDPSYHIRFLERKNGVLFRMRLPNGEAPWIVAQQRDLFGGQTATQEVLRTDEEPSPQEIEAAFERYDSKEKDTGEKLVDFLDKDKGKPG
eukprot:TRINITY_DN49776_c0_g1_i1.p1 TRINITY_DN49776_c0_g1~~TRINITY_DN49776_c0_g1_i1.p1  ORF type:complete len:379 (+),score=98.99 TRINITY_DN49776_c0_g1_i1:36-1172(+)